MTKEIESMHTHTHTHTHNRDTESSIQTNTNTHKHAHTHTQNGLPKTIPVWQSAGQLVAGVCSRFLQEGGKRLNLHKEGWYYI